MVIRVQIRTLKAKPCKIGTLASSHTVDEMA